MTEVPAVISCAPPGRAKHCHAIRSAWFHQASHQLPSCAPPARRISRRTIPPKTAENPSYQCDEPWRPSWDDGEAQMDRRRTADGQLDVSVEQPLETNPEIAGPMSLVSMLRTAPFMTPLCGLSTLGLCHLIGFRPDVSS